MKRIAILFSPFLILFSITSCNKDNEDSPSSNDSPTIECPDDGSPLFVENLGIVKIDMATAIIEDTDWSLSTDIENFTGQGVLIWNGPASMGNPGVGLLTFKLNITIPGTYRFLWRSKITVGNDNTEHNDSWLRIPDASHFYGMKSNGHIVYPKGTELPPIPESWEQENTEPNGSGRDGWFKVFMNNTNWRWQSSTSDHDGHDIYAVFDSPGVYTIEISGRSPGHGIDTFVLFHEDYTEAQGTDEELSFSESECQ
ncbi:MAG: hypothetical protein AAGC47_12320 [Bacteroidota bacterium]